MALFRPTYTDKKTGERKQSATWWFEFIIAGRRYRESTKTSRKTLAADFEARRRREIEKHLAHGGEKPQDVTRMLRTVAEAVQGYIDRYDGPHHQASSVAWVKERSAGMVKHLGSVSLMDLSEERIAAYMKSRTKAGIGPRTINMELLILSRAVGRTWKQLWPNIPKLVEPTDVGRAISPEEEGRILGAAAHNKSPFILRFIQIASLTGMRSGEIRTLRVGQVDLQKQQLRVGKAKTAAGTGRGIPLNDDLAEVIRKQIEWLGAKFGKPQPGWYLFPVSDNTGPIDPTRPVTTLKSAWETVRRDAGVECRFHDLRHTAATKMAENNVPEATMKALLGHMSQAMIERYSHIRNEAKRNAVQGLVLAKPIVTLKPGTKGAPKVSPKVGRN